jgi:myo-inositol-1(or 4)-monophosphatase
MVNMDWNRLLTFTTDTCDRVGARLLADFGRVSSEEKSDGSLVTEADKWADAEIRRSIAATFPEHAILSEEGNHLFTAADWTWVIDPLDGTTNFTRGVPLWAIVVGLLYRGNPVFGYVYLPTLNRRYYGYWPGDTGLEMPQGAYLNDRSISVSPDNLGSNHFFSFCARSIKALKPGFPCKVRMLGVASYNFLCVADGTMLGGIEATPKIWDFAGVYPILLAAGGTWVSLLSAPIFPATIDRDYGSYPLTSMVVSQPELAPIFLPLVSEIALR